MMNCGPAAKAMYKLEPALAEGGELIIYAPHLDVVSHVHGKYIYEIGYHVLPYFLGQWDRFKHIPLGVLAHSTHVTRRRPLRKRHRISQGQCFPGHAAFAGKRAPNWLSAMSIHMGSN